MKPVSIPNPCSEDWNAMNPKAEGRFCASCTKVVVDFRNMTNDEIRDYLAQRKNEKVCGRFRESQVNTKKRSFRFIRFAASVMLAFGAFLFSGVSLKAGMVRIDGGDTTKKKNKHDSVTKTKHERELMGKPAPPKKEREHELMGDVAPEPK